MITRQHNQKRSREHKLGLESLDTRIVPAAAALNLAVPAEVASVNPSHNSETSVKAESAIEIKQQNRLARIAERKEAAHERHEAAVARREAKRAELAAKKAARDHITLAGPVRVQFITVPTATSARAATAKKANVSAPPSVPVSPAPAGTGSTGGSATTTPVQATPVPTTPSANPLPANVSTVLDNVYEEYLNGDLPSTRQPGTVEIQGTTVGIEIHDSNPSDFAAMVAQAQSLGLQVNDNSATYDIVDGFLPISALPSLAQLPASASVTPLLYPSTNLN